jgi:ankyrin repeat protein
MATTESLPSLARLGEVDWIKEALDANARRLNEKDGDGNTGQSTAPCSKHIDTRAHLILPPLLLDSALIVASIEGDGAIVTELVRRGAQVNTKNRAGSSALIEAAKNGQLVSPPL